jgi:hypothetical protein
LELSFHFLPSLWRILRNTSHLRSMSWMTRMSAVDFEHQTFRCVRAVIICVSFFLDKKGQSPLVPLSLCFRISKLYQVFISYLLLHWASHPVLLVDNFILSLLNFYWFSISEFLQLWLIRRIQSNLSNNLHWFTRRLVSCSSLSLLCITCSFLAVIVNFRVSHCCAAKKKKTNSHTHF